jgi:hypothetical protein
MGKPSFFRRPWIHVCINMSNLKAPTDGTWRNYYNTVRELPILPKIYSFILHL